MPTWNELKDYARSKYVLDDDGDDGFSLIFEFDNHRTQKIGIAHFVAFDKDWIEFRSYVCKEAQMDHLVALRKNEDFAIGALAVDEDGDYCLLYSVPLATMDPDEFELPLHVLAHIADDLEQSYTDGDAF
jgi:hypothetical protein